MSKRLVRTEKALEDLRNDVEDLKRGVKVLNCSHDNIEFMKGETSSMGMKFFKTCSDCGKGFGILSERGYLKERHVILKNELKEVKDRMKERGDDE